MSWWTDNRKNIISQLVGWLLGYLLKRSGGNSDVIEEAAEQLPIIIDTAQKTANELKKGE